MSESLLKWRPSTHFSRRSFVEVFRSGFVKSSKIFEQNAEVKNTTLNCRGLTTINCDKDFGGKLLLEEEEKLRTLVKGLL